MKKTLHIPEHPCRNKYTVAIWCITLLLILSGFRVLAQDPVIKKPVLKPSTEIQPEIPVLTGRFFSLFDTIRIAFIGDVMQHGSQIRSARMAGADPDKISSYDYSLAFKYIRKRLDRADLAVANMEFPMGILPYSGYPLFSAPAAIAIEAKNSGIGLFQLANNHLLDQGKAGMERTLQLYDSIGVPYTGAYHNRETEQSENPKIVDIRGVRIAFINFTYGTNGNAVPPPLVMNLMDSTHVKEVIRRGFDREADLVIALPHWGNEYELSPSARQKEWAEMLFRNGVKIIIGTHPHVPQTAELYLSHTPQPRRDRTLEKMIFYSLGNFISNQSIPDYTQLELLVEAVIIKNNLTGECTLGYPEYEFLWCFKKDEFESDYTVIPVKDFLEKEALVKNKSQYKRMVNTYQFIQKKALVKEIHIGTTNETEQHGRKEN